MEEHLKKLLEINEYYKLTINNKDLIPLPETFYKDYKEIIDKCKRKLKEMDFFNPETRKLIAKVNNAERYLRGVLANRVIKMIEKILIENQKEPPPELLEEELKIWNELLKISDRIDYIITGRERKVKVEFLCDVDEFMGIDGKTYGPYKKGDIVELPTSVVKPLENAELVKRVEE